MGLSFRIRFSGSISTMISSSSLKGNWLSSTTAAGMYILAPPRIVLFTVELGESPFKSYSPVKDEVAHHRSYGKRLTSQRARAVPSQIRKPIGALPSILLSFLVVNSTF